MPLSYNQSYNSAVTKLQLLQQSIIECTACPRLVEHCANVAQVKRRAYREWSYWGKPVPSFGDPEARLLILGLAPGAHGSNRTGRMFTGDASGDLLYRVLHQTGFASQPNSRSADDGLVLRDAYIAASVRCAPPDNKPSRDEIARCRPYVERELDLLPRVRVVMALGKLAFDNYLDILRDRGVIRSRAPFPFAHGVMYDIAPGNPVLIGSYHPSQQNTSTGKLTEAMFRKVFLRARYVIEGKRNR
jgi:uracil-DNA glycosylase family 4